MGDAGHHGFLVRRNAESPDMWDLLFQTDEDDGSKEVTCIFWAGSESEIQLFLDSMRNNIEQVKKDLMKLGGNA